VSTITTQLFKDVAFIVYPVSNVKASRSFYEDTLGLTPTAQWQDEWVEYDIGHGTLAIMNADAKHPAGAHGAMIGIEVTDFDAALEALRERGATIADGPYDAPSCRSCVIRDPDGNEIILHLKK
jgi:catechol 2,3-dioxygenase-like lactoylglutathione lyase family enzyme